MEQLLPEIFVSRISKDQALPDYLALTLICSASGANLLVLWNCKIDPIFLRMKNLD